MKPLPNSMIGRALTALAGTGRPEITHREFVALLNEVTDSKEQRQRLASALHERGYVESTIRLTAAGFRRGGIE
jgi:hypothetical protein